jgi:hypothetical protein
MERNALRPLLGADLKHSHALNQAHFRRGSGAINDKGPAISR